VATKGVRRQKPKPASSPSADSGVLAHSFECSSISESSPLASFMRLRSFTDDSALAGVPTDS
jgi:hypothetical protein